MRKMEHLYEEMLQQIQGGNESIQTIAESYAHYLKLPDAIPTRTAEEIAWIENECFDDMDFLQEVDNFHFHCPNCGWWFERGEDVYFEGEDLCKHCAEDAGYNEDEDDF